MVGWECPCRLSGYPLDALGMVVGRVVEESRTVDSGRCSQGEVTVALEALGWRNRVIGRLGL